MRIFATRHGQVLPESYYNGDCSFPVGDPPITELGERQAYAVARRLKDLQFKGFIFSSPYHRTMKTAEIIAGELGCEIFPISCLQEMTSDSKEMREFCGMTAEQLARQYTCVNCCYGLKSPWWEVKQEDLSDVIERVENGLKEILQSLPQDIDVLFVAHAASLVALKHIFCPHAKNYGLHWNCSLSLLYSTNSDTYLNEACFLPKDIRTGNALSYLKSENQWTDTLEKIEKFVHLYRGTKVLHLGDTHTVNYPFTND